MLKPIALLATVTLFAACSSSGDDPDSSGQPTAPTSPQVTPGTPTGTTEGTWVGTSEFGSAVFIIDQAETLYGFSFDGGSRYHSVFGDINGPLERFEHRNSDDINLGEAYTVVGDITEPATIEYDFSVSPDGRTLTNNSDVGSFSLTVAGSASVPPITLASAEGSWESRTVVCSADVCNILQVSMNIAADGTLTGFTKYGLSDEIDTLAEIPLNGTATEAGNFLGIQFVWLEQTRTGVAYFQSGSGKLVLNTYGRKADDTANETFSTLFSR